MNNTARLWLIVGVTVLMWQTTTLAQTGKQADDDALVEKMLVLDSKEGAARGDAQSQGMLGFLYANGKGVAKDLNQAAYWYRKAAEQGHADAQISLGLCYFKGQGVEKDEAEAVRWYRKAADQGHSLAQDKLGISYAYGQGVVKNEIEAYAYWSLAGVTLKAARESVVRLERKLSKDQVEAGVRRTQELKDVITANRAAKAATAGTLSVEKTSGDFSAYKTGAETGDRVAQYKLGKCYFEGNSVAKDPEKAVSWWRKAADQGLAEAQLNLGVCYFKGVGVAQDQVKAVSLWEKAGEQGLAEAQYNLGGSYYGGLGVERDLSQAVAWWRKAANQGEAKSQTHLGLCYATGQGLARDEVEAYAYWSLAGATLEMARTNLAILKTKLGPLRLQAAQDRTRELQKEIEANGAAKASGK
jgi:TPR repeat protein